MNTGLVSAFQSGVLVRAGVFLPVGVALGVLYFSALLWNARLYVSGGSGRALAIQLGRFGVLVGVLSGIAQLGAPCLLMVALGVLAGRTIVLRLFGGAP